MRPGANRLPGAGAIGPERCVACSTCAYACTSGAIRCEVALDQFDWTYNAGLCTFCAQCVNLCPVQALSMESGQAPVYESPEQVIMRQHVPYPPCPECGQPAPLVNDALLLRAFDEITSEVREWSRLCPRCRRRRSQRLLKDNIAVLAKTTKGDG
jgi:formate hydrogenlyase subunit 6/NADH:ubiquinone oxidoreductase subunit I